MIKNSFLGNRKASKKIFNFFKNFLVIFIALALVAPSTVSAIEITRTLDVGAEGQDVSALQRVLKEKGYFNYPDITGFFGNATKAAVQSFQKVEGIVSTGSPDVTGFGRVGPQTLSALNRLPGVDAGISNTYTFTRDLSPGMEGDDVRELQRFLNRFGYLVSASGPGSLGNETTFFGQGTYTALIKFQIASGIKPADGILNAITRLKISSVYPGSSNTDPAISTFRSTSTPSFINPVVTMPSESVLNRVSSNGYEIVISWDRVDRASYYGIYQRFDRALDFVASTTATSYSLRMSKGDTNYYVVKAFSSSGEIATSGEIKVHIARTGGSSAGGPTISVPGQVTGLSVTAGDAQNELSWTAPASDGGSAITDYLIEVSTGGSYSTVADGTNTNTSYTHESLNNGTTYTYRVSAINSAGTGTASDTASGTPEEPVFALIETGSYTGNGTTTTQDIDGSFEPDIVFVMPANSDPVTWRNRTTWHGRSQFLINLPSEYSIGSKDGMVWEDFDGDGFSVTGNANKSGVTYHWIAIRDNGSGIYQSSSWVGNAVNPRTIDFTNGTADAMFIKRDSSRSAIFRWEGAANAVSAKLQEGTTTAFTSINDGGITLTNAVTVNENSNTALGEGIEGVGFFEGDNFELVTYTGDGTDNRLISTSFEPSAVMILDGVNDNTASTKHNIIVTDTMTSGDGKPFAGVSITSSLLGGIEDGGVRLGTAEYYNVSGRDYAILVFQNNTEEDVVEETFDLSVSDKGLIANANSTTTLQNFPALSGESTLEFYGRPQFGYANRYLPLIMLGTSSPGTLATEGGTYNGGLYLYSTDPDTNGWLGPTLRVIHSDYLSRDRTEGSINYYNLNTGVTVPWGKDVHILVTHNGSGHWQVYLNGEKVKDYNVDLDQATYGNRTNGGTGVDKGAHLLSGGSSVGVVGISGRAYNVAVWDGTELTREEARERYESFLEGGDAYAGPDPDKEYDFRGSSLPDDVTANGSAHGPWVAARTQTPFFLASGSVTAQGTPTVEADGDVVVTTNPGSSNGRTRFIAAVGTPITIRTRLSYNDASRIILRYGTDTTGGTGTTVFDLTGSGTIDRTDTITMTGPGTPVLHYVGITSAGQSFIIHPETSVTWE